MYEIKEILYKVQNITGHRGTRVSGIDNELC